MQHMRNATTSVATMVDPTGVPVIMEIISPKTAHTTENTAEKTVTFLKLRNILMAESAGNMISAEISKEPTRFMASTMITAMTTAIRKLYALVRTPEAFEKLSSKVTAKILL